MSSVIISVIIPTYKDWTRLKLCLEALTKQTYPANQFEVIVVNNDPEETCPYELPAPNMKKIIEIKPGSYAARNAGISIAKGDILAFTDSDCIPDEGWLEQGITWLIYSTYDRVAGAVKIFPSDNNPKYINKYESIFAIRQDIYSKDKKAVTANLFVKRDLFNSIGLFDDSVFSGSDMKWNEKATLAGFSLIYVPESFVLHPARSKGQIIAKTKRLFPNHLERLTKKKSKLFLFFFGVYHLRPPIKYYFELLRNRHSLELSTSDFIYIMYFIYFIRIIRFKHHYFLLFGGNKERR